MVRLDWGGFDAAVGHIARSCPKDVPGVYGHPRGGLPLAVALSHRLRVPMLTFPRPDLLVVDDIRDSGQTLRYLQEQGARNLWVWVTREVEPKGYSAVLTGVRLEWVLFPWEDPAQAEEDRRAYEASRA